ncbi:hypothetical protein SKAU_G00015620 [Synaphobranchus kaupii]|uniref:Peptidase aspartic putative domain-containing protein n=1 Tax=Synaphobranchus kaupii TaxID=118154 RepID=A0A9Q1GC49_SYNKA|nr:hypothetical protein SKAU_G00015620 [Synaphobranchus kaupii]
MSMLLSLEGPQAQRRSIDPQSGASESRVYLTPSIASSKVLLKVVPVLLHNDSKSMETFAVLDDGAQRTMILTAAAQQLQLTGECETIALRTVRTDLTHLRGSKVSFEISPKDHVHLITATKPVCRGANGGPIAIHTALEWAVQGSEGCGPEQTSVQQCLFSSVASPDDLLYRNVERLWQLVVLPFQNEKMVVRSCEDQEAMNIFETKTRRVNVEGIQRYAIPLLRKTGEPKLNSFTHSVIAHLRATEKRLKKDPEKAAIYSAEFGKLLTTGLQLLIQAPGGLNE